MKALGKARRVPRAVIAMLAIAVFAAVAAVAYAATQQPAIQTFTPQRAEQVTNIDVLRQQIRNYYGDPLGTGQFADTSNYANEARSVAEQGERWLAARAHPWGTAFTGKSARFKKRTASKPKAIVLDVDDTTLATWNYEIASNWAYNPTTNAQFVTEQRFPVVPGMLDLVKQAAAEGYAVFFLTGRPATQEAATLGNLTSDGVGVDAGYPAPTTLSDGEDGLFTKPAVADYPDYLKAACTDELSTGASCTTIHYKAATRAHIESLGYDIVANFGDQFSDLKGGSADRAFKLPNPNYYLP